MTYEQALEQLGLNPDIRLRQMFELGRLSAPAQDDQAHYKEVIESVQALFDDKRKATKEDK